MSHINPVGPIPKLTGEPRQLLFLALCSLALVVAAFAAPPTAQGTSPPDVPNPFGNESGTTGECIVSLSEDPVPGRDVTVSVHRGGAPVEDVRVWFNDSPVGVTNRSGQVVGTVPYVRNLEVTVGLPGGGSCEFVTATADRTADRSLAEGSEQSEGRDVQSEQEDVQSEQEDVQSERKDLQRERERHLGASAVQGVDRRPAAQATDEVNVSDSYPLPYAISVDVEGQADPGETVALVATLRGEPVPAATVSVDGDEVGTTDADGRHTLAIPDDGTRTLTVDVQRGEIRGRHQIHVRLLQVAVRGEELFPLPGQSATVRAAIGTDAAVGADVLLDGEHVGTTNARGETTIALPADPTATVAVTTGDRTARTALIPAFAPTIVSVVGVLVVVVGVPLAVYWAGGRRALAGLFGLAANLVTGAAGYAVAGRDGALFAVGSTILLFLLVVFLRRPRLARDAGESTSRFLDSSVDRITSGVLWFTRGVEVLIDQTVSSLDRAFDHLRDFELVAMAAGVRTWLVALPGLVLSGLVAIVRAPRRLVEWFRSRSTPEEEEAGLAEAETASTVTAPGPAIRELWRAFARSVVPDRWPQRTPGEVSRRAIDAGFPRESVVELTTVFRDVEYGGESFSDDHYQRARTAFDTLGVDDRDAASHDVGAGDTGDGGTSNGATGGDGTNGGDTSDRAGEGGVTGS